MSKITRRNALKSIPVCGLATILPAAAQADDLQDADLLRLEAEFNTAYDRFDAAVDRAGRIEESVKADKPPKPVEVPMPKDLDEAFIKLTIEQIRDNHPVCQAMHRHREECSRLIEAWRQECKAVERHSGLADAEAERDRLCDEAGDAAEAVLDLPAMTLSGILIKLRVHDRWTFNDDEILGAITADIAAMAGVQS